jgi:hypothetical protein
MKPATSSTGRNEVLPDPFAHVDSPVKAQRAAWNRVLTFGDRKEDPVHCPLVVDCPDTISLQERSLSSLSFSFLAMVF